MIWLYSLMVNANPAGFCPECKRVRFESHETGWCGQHPDGQLRWIITSDTEQQEQWIKGMKKRYWKSPFPKPEDSATEASATNDPPEPPNVLRSTNGKICILQLSNGLLLGASKNGCTMLENKFLPAEPVASTQPSLTQNSGCWVLQPQQSRFKGGEVKYQQGLACFSLPPTEVTVIEQTGASTLWGWDELSGEYTPLARSKGPQHLPSPSLK